ncbi:MAG: S8 family serine peptidase [Melioribacteraceae bacterium]|nr:S8 family serine peptidase [Melioribacteraceae bacterium]
MMLRIVTVLLLLTTYIFALDPAQQQQDQLIEPGKIIVKYKKVDSYGSVNKSAKVQLSSQYGLQAEEQIFNKAKNTEVKQLLNLNNVFEYQVSKATDIFSLANRLSKDPNVEYAEPVYINRADAEPNDPMYSSQQHLPQVSAPQAWDDQFGDSSVIIAVIDSGVDWDHEDLAGVIWSNDDEVLDGTDTDGNGYIDDIRGWDFVDGREGNGDTDAVPDEDGTDPDNDPMDFGGHGSHVAGISAAHTNNSVGIASVSSGASVMPLRIGWQANDGNGYGNSSFMAQAFIYAADNGAHVANLSYGNSGQTIIEGAFYAFLNGVLVIESAGNSNNQNPSALGFTRLDNLSSFSRPR